MVCEVKTFEQGENIYIHKKKKEKEKGKSHFRAAVHISSYHQMWPYLIRGLCGVQVRSGAILGSGERSPGESAVVL